MAKKQYTEDEIKEIVEKFINEKENFNLWQFDSMDAYVAINHPEDLDKWMEKCFDIPKKKQTNGKPRSDIKTIRKMFLEDYFPDHTEEAIKQRKLEDKEKKAREKAEREARKKLSDKERRILELKQRFNIE